MGSKTFVVSDMHFYHGGIIDLDGRPYKSEQDMNFDLIKRWNETVKEEDTVYMLGDTFYRASGDKVHEILSQLNGDIIYIYGNHERPIIKNKGVAEKYFKETHKYLEIHYKDGDNKHQNLVLSHYPIPMFNGHFYTNTTHFYGHVHVTEEQLYTVYQQLMNFNLTNDKGKHKMLNVGVMMSYMDLRPQKLGDMIDLAKERTTALYHYFNEECNQEMPTIEEFRKHKHLYL